MLPRLAYLLAASAVLLDVAHALSVEFSRVSTAPQTTESTFHINIDIANAQKDQDANDVFSYQNSNNVSGSNIYVATLKLGGKDFVVQLDTGSSDLWIDTTGLDLSGFTATGIETGLTYGDGTVAQGPVYIGQVTLGDFTVNSAFISAPGTNATTNQDKGLLGIGPPQLSSIAQALTSSSFNGDTLLGNIFTANGSLPQFTSFTLSRSFATGKTDGGIFTIGEVPTNLTGIENAPKNTVVSQDRWIVLMDGIIVDGRNVTGGSSFEAKGQTTGQTLANLDTGTSLAQIPKEYADVIYGSIPGAQELRSSGVYIVPCGTRVNVSFVFSGIAYPVHPIDTVAATTDDRGGVLCFSGFTFGTSGSEDFLLGDSFLRNVYSLYDYGSFENETTAPYIQLLATTNADSAYAEFNTLSTQRNQTLTSGSSSGGSSSSAAVPSSRVRINTAVLAIGVFTIGTLVF